MALTFRSGLAADPAGKAGLAQFVADAAQEGTATRDSRRLRDEVFAMGASLGAAVGQDASTFTMRGLAETLPQMLDLLADVVRRPTFPETEVQLLTANAAQRVQAQLASASFVSNRQFRSVLFGDAPLRPDRGHARLGQGDRSGVDCRLPRGALPAQQRLPRRHRRRRRRGGDGGGGEGVRRLGARRRSSSRRFRRRRPSRAASSSSCTAPAACSRRSRSATSPSSATTRAGSCCSWPTRSTAARSIRGWCATSARRRAIPTRRSRSSPPSATPASTAPSPTCATTSPARR